MSLTTCLYFSTSQYLHWSFSSSVPQLIYLPVMFWCRGLGRVVCLFLSGRTQIPSHTRSLKFQCSLFKDFYFFFPDCRYSTYTLLKSKQRRKCLPRAMIVQKLLCNCTAETLCRLHKSHSSLPPAHLSHQKSPDFFFIMYLSTSCTTRFWSPHDVLVNFCCGNKQP